MFTQADLALLVLAKHDLSVLRKLIDLLAGDALAAWRTVVVAEGAALQSSFDSFRGAARTASRETIETSEARAKLANAMERLIQWYGYYYRHARAVLSNPLPTEDVSDATMRSRRSTLERVFPGPPSEFANMAMQRRVQIARTLADELGDEGGALSRLGLNPDFATAVQQAEQADADLQVESNEDQDARVALEEQRNNHLTSSRAYDLAVRGALTRLGRLEAAGQYLLARDASYRARRRAGTSVTEEPGATELIEEVGQPTGGPPADTTTDD